MGFCKKPDCDRWVPAGILYCCHQCDIADQGKYEIHEDGDPLGHATSCIENFKERGSNVEQRKYFT